MDSTWNLLSRFGTLSRHDVMKAVFVVLDTHYRLVCRRFHPLVC